MDPAMAIEVAALSKQKSINEAMCRGDSEVQRFYNNSVVFITGGSGFLGKQLIEKLLRSCQISKVFMLLRSKKEKSVQERMEEIFNDPAFETLRQYKPDFSDKIIAVEGDVAEIRLGIKDEDWETLSEEVNVIFHVAATTRFDETLRLASLINVRGTREALLLGRACKNLRSYVHVSTAYSHATTTLVGEEIQEEFYSASVPPEAMISMAENMDPERLINITTKLIKNWPNTYTFTKAISEELVRTMSVGLPICIVRPGIGMYLRIRLIKNWPNTYTFTKAISEELVRTMSVGLPICIVRPGIVLCTYREPLPGWLDTSCVYGASGFVLGAGLGVLHTAHLQLQTKLGTVPCDYVNNAIIVAGRETATNQAKGGDDTRIYTVSSTYRNSLTWGRIKEVLVKEGRKIPSPKSIYHGYCIETSSKLLYMFLTLFLHIIPAYLADFVFVLTGKERRFVKMAKKVYRMCNTLSYFLLNEWQFVDDNLVKLYSGLSKHDKAIFNFDVTDINWTEYVLIWCMGIRKYIIKDGLKDTDYGIKKQQYLKIAHYFIMTLYIYSIWNLFI